MHTYMRTQGVLEELVYFLGVKHLIAREHLLTAAAGAGLDIGHMMPGNKRGPVCLCGWVCCIYIHDFCTKGQSISNQQTASVYIHTYKHTYIHTYIHTYMHTYISSVRSALTVSVYVRVAEET
jgi:hypothetical protein